MIADFKKNVLPSSITIAGAKIFVKQPKNVFPGSLFKNLKLARQLKITMERMIANVHCFK